MREGDLCTVPFVMRREVVRQSRDHAATRADRRAGSALTLPAGITNRVGRILRPRLPLAHDPTQGTYTISIDRRTRVR